MQLSTKISQQYFKSIHRFQQIKCKLGRKKCTSEWNNEKKAVGIAEKSEIILSSRLSAAMAMNGWDIYVNEFN